MKRYIFALMLLLAVTAVPGISFAAGEPEFSAVFVEKNDRTVETGKIYVTKNMSRFETDGRDEIVVNRYDKGVMWIVFPKLRLYAEEPCAGGDFSNPPRQKDTGGLSRKSLGHEMIDSYRLKKFLVTVTYDEKKEQKDQYYEWYRDGFPFPVKTSSLNGNFSYEYTKIKNGPQNPELFAFPKNYKKVTMQEIEAMKSPAQGEAKDAASADASIKK